jgi:predicted transcriptional regulator of viral defense system
MRSHAPLAALADKQHGVVSYRQLREMGFSKGAVWRMSEAQRLHRVHRGIYAVRHSNLSSHGRCLAAVLACSEGAVLSHESAAWLWGLFSLCPARPQVTVVGAGHRRRGIRVSHVASLSPADHGEMEGIPVTSFPRTMLDLAATVTPRLLQEAVEKAERLGVLDIVGIDAVLSRRPVSGAAKLRRALEIYRDPIVSRARSERLFLALIKKAGLPRPAINYFVAGHEIDAYWETERFAVEIDGWDAHRSRRAFEQDPLRHENLKLAGIDSMRITARRLEKAPDEVGSRLRIILARRRAELGS